MRRRVELGRRCVLTVSPRLSRSDDRGTLLALFAILALVIFGLTGAVVDMGLGYVSKAQLSRAVDAGVLAGAKNLRRGEAAAQAQALSLAETNGVSGASGVSIDVEFGRNLEGENTVSMTATRSTPTIFLRALGMNELTIGSAATATVPPLDLVLVLDQSGSLATHGAFGDLQIAAKEFTGNFDEALDQMGLASFQLRAADRFLISGGFLSSIEGEIDSMVSVGATNVGEGLRLALGQMQLPAVRERAGKAIVFFTDGRANAFRGVLGPGGPAQGGSSLGPFVSGIPGVEDRMMAVGGTITGRLVGYFDDPDSLPIDGLGPPDGCIGAADCWGWGEWEARQKAIDAGLEVANAIRSEGIHIYSIGLGDPGATPIEQPDMDYLRAISNEGGMVDANQPRGRAYFAPSPAELRSVFRQVAGDLLVRLTQ